MSSKWGAIALAAVIAGAGHAQAGLVGNSITSLNYYTPDQTMSNATPQIELISQSSNYPFAIGASGLYFLTGGADAPIYVGDTQLVIGSNLAGPFCNAVSPPCPGTFNGFVFDFSSGVDITNVAIDSVTPNTSNWRNAAITFSPTEVKVDLRAVSSPQLPTIINGDGSNMTDLLNELSSTLVLDLSFNGNGNGNTSAPEPATLSLLGAGLLGLAATRRRRRG